MSQSKTKTAAEDLMATLMAELNLSADDSSEEDNALVGKKNIEDKDSVILSMSLDDDERDLNMAGMLNPSHNLYSDNTKATDGQDFSVGEESLLDLNVPQNSNYEATEIAPQQAPVEQDLKKVSSNEATVALKPVVSENQFHFSDNEKTVPIASFLNRTNQAEDNNVKVSIGKSRPAFSSGYATWGNSDSQVAQAENLRIAQEKILELERENEKLRFHNEEMVAASEIIKERAELLTAQVHEYKNDRDSLEQSFKNEMQLLRNQLQRKDSDLQKAQMKIDELDSRLKFDMKKIRIRERELENRLELVRAEKNALVKSKDEQILDLRRKMDQVQLEIESYRQKCVDLNKALDTNQDSFKRTTRALRLAMANLELQDENKIPLKKAE